MRLRVAFMLACACFAGVQPGFAQASVQTPAAQRAEQGGQTAMVSVLDLTPNAAERFARALQLSYGIADVADFRVINDAFAANPDRALRKATVAFRGTALFRTASDIRSAFATVADNATTFKEFAAVADPFSVTPVTRFSGTWPEAEDGIGWRVSLERSPRPPHGATGPGWIRSG